jgi:hypothetical protein
MSKSFRTKNAVPQASGPEASAPFSRVHPQLSCPNVKAGSLLMPTLAKFWTKFKASNNLSRHNADAPLEFSQSNSERLFYD